MHWRTETSGVVPVAGMPRNGRRTARAELVAVALVALAAALAAAFLTDASPTGWPLADALERGALVGLSALAGSRARRWTLMWAGAVGLALGGTVGRVLGGLVVAATALLFVLHRRDRVVGAALGGAAALSVLDLQWPPTTGVTALAAAAALVPLLITGVRHASRVTRRRVAVGAAVLGVAVLVGLAGAAVFGLQQRSAVNVAVDRTRSAVDVVGGSDQQLVKDRFAEASDAFAGVEEAASAWWLVPARALPVVGNNLELVRTAASSGARLDAVAADLSTAVDQSSLRRPGGGIDLAVLASMQRPVDTAAAELQRAATRLDEADSPWLVSPVQRALGTFRQEVRRTRSTAVSAQLAVRRAPALLGADGPRRYLMLLGNPAEARDIGGHLGNWAEVVADDGVLKLVEVGMPYDLFSPDSKPPPSMTPGAYPQSLVEARPQYYPQNWGTTPDMATIAHLAAELYPQARPGAPLDGVFYADPAAFAALLEITGPVPLKNYPVTLSAGNAVDFLTKGQFPLLPEGSDALNDVIKEALDKFTAAKLPSPRRLVDVFGPVVRQGRLQFFSLHPEDDALLRRTGLSGEVGAKGQDDVLSVLNRNANPNKIDAYLKRDITYDVHWNPTTGATTARVTIRLTNALPPVSSLPDVVVQTPAGVPRGTNRTQLAVLSALDATRATLDGDKTGIGTQQELPGVRRHTILVDIPPGATRTVTLDLQGTIGGGDYTLRWVGQPLVDPGRVHVTVTPTGPGVPAGARPTTRSFRADEDRTVVVADPRT